MKGGKRISRFFNSQRLLAGGNAHPLQTPVWKQLREFGRPGPLVSPLLPPHPATHPRAIFCARITLTRHQPHPYPKEIQSDIGYNRQVQKAQKRKVYKMTRLSCLVAFKKVKLIQLIHIHSFLSETKRMQRGCKKCTLSFFIDMFSKK